MSSPIGYARSSAVLMSLTYPFPKRSPDRALGPPLRSTYFPAYGRGGPAQAGSYSAHRLSGRKSPGDLLPLSQAERPPRPASLGWSDPASGFEYPVNRAGRLLQSPSDVANGLSGLPPIPQLLLAHRRQSRTTQISHTHTSDPNNAGNPTVLHRPVESTVAIFPATHGFVCICRYREFPRRNLGFRESYLAVIHPPA